MDVNSQSAFVAIALMDGTSLDRTVASHAIRLTSHGRGRVILEQIMPLPTRSRWATGLGRTIEPWEQIEAVEANVRRRLREIARRAGGSAEVETAVHFGSYLSILAEIVNKEPGGVVVVVGRNQLRRRQDWQDALPRTLAVQLVEVGPWPPVPQSLPFAVAESEVERPLGAGHPNRAATRPGVTSGISSDPHRVREATGEPPDHEGQ
jgi:hypothetical protein